MRSGRVTVNGRVVRELGAKADPDTDDIRVDGKPIPKSVRRVYVLLNKPTGYVTTVRDPHAERTVMDLLTGIKERVYPVGRLDADTAGLLLLTNDGAFAQKLLHPSHQVARTYRAVVQGLMDEFAVTDLRKGVALEDGLTAPAEVVLVERNHANRTTVVEITVREGRNRQVRRMLDAVGHRVLALTRIAFGPLRLSGLAPGTWRRLRPKEVADLLRIAEGSLEEGDDGV